MNRQHFSATHEQREAFHTKVQFMHRRISSAFVISIKYNEQTIYLLLDTLGVGSEALATRGGDDVDESTVVLDSLLSTATSSLLLFLGLNLRGLVLYLSGTGKRSVDLATASKAKNQVEGGLLLDVVVASSFVHETVAYKI